MPELPEVELCALKLRAWCVGRTVKRVHAEPGPPLRGDTTPASLRAALRGRRVLAIERVGKQLLLRTDGPRAVLLHLGMTGDWSQDREGARIVFELDQGLVAMRDVRRLGRVRVVQADALDAAPEWSELGPDALAMAGQGGALSKALGRAKVPLKVALMDQKRLAGVGNIYASEACFAAGVDPRRIAATVDRATFDRVGHEIVAAMQRTLDQGRDDPNFAYLSEGGENIFAVYGREGLPCRVCGAEIERFEQAGRSTFACPKCQRRGRARRAGRAGPRRKAAAPSRPR